MTASDRSNIVQLKINRMMLIDDNTIHIIKKMKRNWAYYGDVTAKSDPSKLPFVTHDKARDLHMRFKSGGWV
jgi:hypothetical protein